MATPEQDRALAIVLQVHEIHFEGNIIPHEWYHHILYPNGKPHLVAIVLLAEITYWYRPRVELDERTGRVLGYYKRFAGDMLQRTQTALATKFGLTRQQVRDGLDRLKELHLIRTELRDITSADGTPLSNVLYIEVDPSELRRISAPSVLQTTPSVLQASVPRSTEPTYTQTSTKIKKDIDYGKYATPDIEHMFPADQDD